MRFQLAPRLHKIPAGLVLRPAHLRAGSRPLAAGVPLRLRPASPHFSRPRSIFRRSTPQGPDNEPATGGMKSPGTMRSWQLLILHCGTLSRNTGCNHCDYGRTFGPGASPLPTAPRGLALAVQYAGSGILVYKSGSSDTSAQREPSHRPGIKPRADHKPLPDV